MYFVLIYNKGSSHMNISVNYKANINLQIKLKKEMILTLLFAAF